MSERGDCGGQLVCLKCGFYVTQTFCESFIRHQRLQNESSLFIFIVRSVGRAEFLIEYVVLVSCDEGIDTIISDVPIVWGINCFVTTSLFQSKSGVDNFHDAVHEEKATTVVS